MSVEEKRREVMSLGAQGYIVKPYALEELRAELEKLIRDILVAEQEKGATA